MNTEGTRRTRAQQGRGDERTGSHNGWARHSNQVGTFESHVQDQKAQHSTSTHHILGRDLNDMLAAILFTLSSRSFFLLLSERNSCRISLTLWKFSSFAFP